MVKYNSACSSLRRGQLNRLIDKIKDKPIDKTEDKSNKKIAKKRRERIG